MLRLLAFLALFIAAPAAASDLDGSWDLKSDDAVIFRLTVHDSSATWIHPKLFSTNGDGFSDVTGPAVTDTTRDIHPVGGDLELTFKDPAPGSSPAVLRLHKAADGRVTMNFVGMGVEPFDLTRTTADTALGPWDPARLYALTRPHPTNARMTAIFDADQDARKPGFMHIDWKIVGAQDAERRKETQALLDAGALQSGDDFFHAAFVFQHGDRPDDFLKAHLLAMVAVARGRGDALWIASATLDRYLQNIKQPQVLGTQYTVLDGKAGQEPYNRALASDALRRALKVATLAEQEEQRKRYEAQAASPKAEAPKPAP